MSTAATTAAPPSAPSGAPRRTFAIISHPDAGKTTLTEHLLLMGGAIRLAGEVKAKGERRRARSDWMKIEQQRGISVTTAVMTFERDGVTFNLLDTPGHEDFSEDTYRTLTAADSAVMVLDAARGIEAQTLKLFEVCRLRDIPILTFINKMDRETRDPLELLDEIAARLALETAPVTWPLGMGQGFRGVANLYTDEFIPFSREGAPHPGPVPLTGPAIEALLSPAEREKLAEDADLVRGVYPPFDETHFREGHLTPVFFGSALKGFGVKELLDTLAAAAPGPGPRHSTARDVAPDEPKVSGFVFKVQANMDPKHRDRVAFLRLCSGKFKRGMQLRQTGTGKTVAIHNPILFFAREREIVDEAFPGDIIGIPNHGVLRVGDTLTEGEDLAFTGIPDFAPEILRRIRPRDPMRAKHLGRALEALAEEGVTQVFKPMIGSANWIIGVVGQLQLDVLASRMVAEYDIDAILEASPYETARWVLCDDAAALKSFLDANTGQLATDRDNAPVFLAKGAWELNYAAEKWPQIRFAKTKERA